MNPVRVLVTGATGFIGSAVCRHLVAARHEVHAVRRAHIRAPEPSLPPLHWHVHDETDKGMRRIMSAASPDVVVHVAALVPRSDNERDDVDALVRANILFGTQVLTSAVDVGCQHFVNTGTYWEHYGGTRAVSLYAALKQAFGRVLDHYCDAHGMRAVTLAIYDTYGPHDPRGKFLALLVRAAETGDVLDATDGLQQVDVVHVDDVARAFGVALGVVATLPAGGHRTFGVRSGTARSLRSLADVVAGVLGRPVPVNWGARPRQPRTFETPPDLPPLPGWAARITLEDGVSALATPAQHG